MYPITNDVKALFEAEQPKVLRITGTDKNGTTITITDNDVIADSFQVDRYSCNGEKLEVGTAIAAQMTLTLENGGGQYNGIVFEGAELFVEVGIADWTQSSPTITYVPCGYFTPDEQPRRLSTISITGLDRMTKFDVVVDAADFTFPTTVAGLVGQVCTLCGVTLAQSISGLVNAGVNVTEMPEAQEEITYRNLIQWCAGVMGTNAWFDWNGQLRFSWYANATGYVSTADNRYSSDLYEDDLTVSGVEYTNDSGIVIVEGTDDYAIDLTGNAIVGSLVATVLPPLNTALNGFTYRPFTAATVNAPYLWPMDVVTFTDKNGSNHTSALTNVAFGLNGTTAMESKGMTYAINKLAQPKGFTREQAQLVSRAMEHVEQDIDDSLTQQEIFNRLTDNGAAQGLVLYNGQLYINASYINAGYLNVGRINFNEPDRYYDVPNENDPDSLLSGQTVVDGWIVNASGTGKITVFSCGFAIPLRGKTITVTFTYKDNSLSGGTDSWSSISSTAEQYGEQNIWYTPSTTVPNPYTYTVTVPDDAMSFRMSMDCTGVKQINVSLDSPIVPSDSIEYNYEGQRIGERNPFHVYRDGTLITYAKSIFSGAARFSEVYLDSPLDVDGGGTGATTPAAARANLGITPANIGAVSTSDVINVTHGGTGASSEGMARLNFFPDDLSNESVVFMAGFTGSWAKGGWLQLPLSLSHGGTGATNAADARANLEITPANIGAVATSAVIDIPHGGTGATTAAGARANLEITPANIGAVAKSGDTMTGSLTIKGSWPGYNLQPNNGSQTTVSFVASDTDGHGFFETRSLDGTKHDWYNLPNSTTNGGYYNILTDKSPVTIPQGGTGATTAADARANLGITPANIGAVDADALTIKPWGVNGESILANNGIYARSYNPNILPSQGAPTGFSTYASALSVTGSAYPIVAYIDVFGNLAIWNSNQNRWEVYHRNGYVYGIAEGGTGATDAPGARANLGIATTLTTFQTEGITANGNFDTGLKPSLHVIDAIYCTAGYIAITPYSNGSDKWFAHCIHPTTGAPITSNFNVTIRYHNIY